MDSASSTPTPRLIDVGMGFQPDKAHRGANSSKSTSQEEIDTGGTEQVSNKKRSRNRNLFGAPLVDAKSDPHGQRGPEDESPSSSSQAARANDLRLASKQIIKSLVTRYRSHEDQRRMESHALKNEAKHLTQGAANVELRVATTRALKETCIELLRKELAAPTGLRSFCAGQDVTIPDDARWSALVQMAVNHPLSAEEARENEIERQATLESTKGADAESRAQEENFEDIFAHFATMGETGDAYAALLEKELNKAILIRKEIDDKKLDLLKEQDLMGAVDKLSIDHTISILAYVKDVGTIGNVLVEVSEVVQALSDPARALLNKDPIAQQEAVNLLMELASKGVEVYDQVDLDRLNQLRRDHALPRKVDEQIRRLYRMCGDVKRQGQSLCSKRNFLRYLLTIGKRCNEVIQDVRLHEGRNRERLAKVDAALEGLRAPQLALTHARLKSRLAAFAAADSAAIAEGGAAALWSADALRNRLHKPLKDEVSPEGAFSAMELVDCVKDEDRRNALLTVLPEGSALRNAAEKLFADTAYWYNTLAEDFRADTDRDSAGFNVSFVTGRPTAVLAQEDFGSEFVHGAADEVLRAKREERAGLQVELEAEKAKRGEQQPSDESDGDELKEVVIGGESKEARLASKMKRLDDQIENLEKLEFKTRIRHIADSKGLRLMDSAGAWIGHKGFVPAMLWDALRDGGATYIGKRAAAAVVFGLGAITTATASPMAAAAIPAVLAPVGIYLALRRLASLEGASKFEHTQSRLYQFARANSYVNIGLLVAAALTGSGAAIAGKQLESEIAKYTEAIAAGIINTSFAADLARLIRQAIQSFFDRFIPGLDAWSSGLTVTPIYGTDVGISKAHQVEMNTIRDLIYAACSAGAVGAAGQPGIQPDELSGYVPADVGTAGVEAGDAAFPDKVKLVFWLLHQDEYILSREDKAGSWGKPNEEGEYPKSAKEAFADLGNNIVTGWAGRQVFGATTDVLSTLNAGFKEYDRASLPKPGPDEALSPPAKPEPHLAREILPAFIGGALGFTTGPRGRTVKELLGTETTYNTSTGALTAMTRSVALLAPSAREAKRKKELKKQRSNRDSVGKLTAHKISEKRAQAAEVKIKLNYLNALAPADRAYGLVGGLDDLFLGALSPDAQSLAALCAEVVKEHVESAALGIVFHDKDIVDMMEGVLARSLDQASPFFNQRDKLRAAQWELAGALATRSDMLAARGRKLAAQGKTGKKLGDFWSAFSARDFISEEVALPTTTRKRSSISVRTSRTSSVLRKTTTRASGTFALGYTPESVRKATQHPLFKLPIAALELHRRLQSEPDAMELFQGLAKELGGTARDAQVSGIHFDNVMQQIRQRIPDEKAMDDAVEKLLDMVSPLDPKTHGPVWYDLKLWQEVIALRRELQKEDDPPAPGYVPPAPSLEKKRERKSSLFRTRSNSQSVEGGIRKSSIIQTATSLRATVEDKKRDSIQPPADPVIEKETKMPPLPDTQGLQVLQMPPAPSDPQPASTPISTGEESMAKETANNV